MKCILLIIATFFTLSVTAQDKPTIDWDELNKTKPWEITEVYKEVPVVTPGEGTLPPSDAIVLFDGKNLDQWQKTTFGGGIGMMEAEPNIKAIENLDSGKPADWTIDKGELVVAPQKGAIATKKAFGDIQLHLEWKCPVMEDVEGQQYANSGIFLMGLYEIQVLNNYENKTYSNGQVGSVYKQHVPMANASRPPGQWQTYDIYFSAPRFSDNGRVVKPAEVTVVHNGVLVQLGAVIQGPTCFIGEPYYVAHPERLPLVLQDHNDLVRFRNIWVREL